MSEGENESGRGTVRGCSWEGLKKQVNVLRGRGEAAFRRKKDREEKNE
jgi:hypothetical protein